MLSNYLLQIQLFKQENASKGPSSIIVKYGVNLAPYSYNYVINDLLHDYYKTVKLSLEEREKNIEISIPALKKDYNITVFLHLFPEFQTKASKLEVYAIDPNIKMYIADEKEIYLRIDPFAVNSESLDRWNIAILKAIFQTDILYTLPERNFVIDYINNINHGKFSIALDLSKFNTIQNLTYKTLHSQNIVQNYAITRLPLKAHRVFLVFTNNKGVWLIEARQKDLSNPILVEEIYYNKIIEADDTLNLLRDTIMDGLLVPEASKNNGAPRQKHWYVLLDLIYSPSMTFGEKQAPKDYPFFERMEFAEQIIREFMNYTTKYTKKGTYDGNESSLWIDSKNWSILTDNDAEKVMFFEQIRFNTTDVGDSFPYKQDGILFVNRDLKENIKVKEYYVVQTSKSQNYDLYNDKVDIATMRGETYRLMYQYHKLKIQDTMNSLVNNSKIKNILFVGNSKLWLPTKQYKINFFEIKDYPFFLASEEGEEEKPKGGLLDSFLESKSKKEEKYDAIFITSEAFLNECYKNEVNQKKFMQFIITFLSYQKKDARLTLYFFNPDCYEPYFRPPFFGINKESVFLNNNRIKIDILYKKDDLTIFSQQQERKMEKIYIGKLLRNVDNLMIAQSYSPEQKSIVDDVLQLENYPINLERGSNHQKNKIIKQFYPTTPQERLLSRFYCIAQLTIEKEFDDLKFNQMETPLFEDGKTKDDQLTMAPCSWYKDDKVVLISDLGGENALLHAFLKACYPEYQNNGKMREKVAKNVRAAIARFLDGINKEDENEEFSELLPTVFFLYQEQMDDGNVYDVDYSLDSLSKELKLYEKPLSDDLWIPLLQDLFDLRIYLLQATDKNLYQKAHLIVKKNFNENIERAIVLNSSFSKEKDSRKYEVASLKKDEEGGLLQTIFDSESEFISNLRRFKKMPMFF